MDSTRNAYGPTTLLSDLLDAPATRAFAARRLPALVNSPMLPQLRQLPLSELLEREPSLGQASLLDRFWNDLRSLDPAGTPTFSFPARAEIRDDPDSSPGSAAWDIRPGHVWVPAELSVRGPRVDNPFLDVDLAAVFAVDDVQVRVEAFYDGDDTWRVRWLPSRPGTWTFRTESNVASMAGIDGEVDIEKAPPSAHGPVRVDGFHFAHADGTRYHPFGTTAYVWTHQPQEVQERTLRTIRDSAFTKVRMCVFPKAYLYNTNEPERFPFEGDAENGWDYSRFDLEFFRHLERRIRDLGTLGVEADLVLFHAYDRWGFSDMGAEADDHYVRYAARRFSAFPNIWWSMANEFDLLWSKSEEDWERLAALVEATDHVGHLRSIHNCIEIYDHSRPWISHVSMQRVDVYKTSENTDLWRERWQKPVVVDECGYEGDIDQGWGNLTAEEMVRRCWEGAVRGGYVNHGETYRNDRDELWWSKGGDLVGRAPERIAFLRDIVARMPDGRIDPLRSEWDAPTGGSRAVTITYFGFNQPALRVLQLPSAVRHVIDVIDTWNMTEERLDGTFSGATTIPLPGRQWMAVRVSAVDDERPDRLWR